MSGKCGRVHEWLCVHTAQVLVPSSTHTCGHLCALVHAL